MNVILAKSAGFCYGVKRAISIVEDVIAKKEECIYTLGPIIHNEFIVENFAKKGVKAVELKDLYSEKKGTVIIRAHGISSKTEEEIKGLGFTIVDATCPYVKNIHRVVYEHSKKGEHIIVLGSKSHAEVAGIVGRMATNAYSIIENAEDAKKFSLNSKIPIFIVAQTTFNHKLFKECVEIIFQKGYDVNNLDSICSATYDRQSEAERIASNVDAMIVIGGRESSNTNKLYDICKSKCENTFFLQTKADLDPSVMQTFNNVGITAGASTPDKLIREVMMECQK